MVVAVDNTQASWSSVKWALKNLYKEGMVLHLMHVVPKESTRPPMALSASYGVWDSGLEEDVEGHTRSLVDDFRPALDRLAVKYGAVCEVDVVRPKRSQHVGASICERSEELDAIVVVVTHRQYGLLEALLNRASVSDYVAKNCKKPVLVYQHRSGAGSTVLDIVQPAAAP